MTDKLIKRQQEDSKLQEKINPEKERKKRRKRKKERKKKKEMKDLQRMERSYHKMQNQIILIVKW